MSRKHIRLAGLLAKAIKGKYTVTCISEKTGLCERQIKQLKASYRLTKETALIQGAKDIFCITVIHGSRAVV